MSTAVVRSFSTVCQTAWCASPYARSEPICHADPANTAILGYDSANDDDEPFLITSSLALSKIGICLDDETCDGECAQQTGIINQIGARRRREKQAKKIKVFQQIRKSAYSADRCYRSIRSSLDGLDGPFSRRETKEIWMLKLVQKFRFPVCQIEDSAGDKRALFNEETVRRRLLEGDFWLNHWTSMAEERKRCEEDIIEFCARNFRNKTPIRLTRADDGELVSGGVFELLVA